MKYLYSRVGKVWRVWLAFSSCVPPCHVTLLKDIYTSIWRQPAWYQLLFLVGRGLQGEAFKVCEPYKVEWWLPIVLQQPPPRTSLVKMLTVHLSTSFQRRPNDASSLSPEYNIIKWRNGCLYWDRSKYCECLWKSNLWRRGRTKLRVFPPVICHLIEKYNLLWIFVITFF